MRQISKEASFLKTSHMCAFIWLFQFVKVVFDLRKVGFGRQSRQERFVRTAATPSPRIHPPNFHVEPNRNAICPPRALPVSRLLRADIYEQRQLKLNPAHTAAIYPQASHCVVQTCGCHNHRSRSSALRPLPVTALRAPQDPVRVSCGVYRRNHLRPS